MEARMPCKQPVASSILVTSTILLTNNKYETN